MQLYDRIAAGDRIRQRRLLLGMTQEELAEKIGRAYKYCQDIERGSCGMSIETLILLSSSLNVTMDYIIYGYEDTEPKTPEQLLEMEAVEELLGHCSEKKRSYALDPSRALKIFLCCFDGKLTVPSALQPLLQSPRSSFPFPRRSRSGRTS